MAPVLKRPLASYSTCALRLNCACCRSLAVCDAGWREAVHDNAGTELLSKTGGTWLSCPPSFLQDGVYLCVIPSQTKVKLEEFFVKGVFKLVLWAFKKIFI